MKALNNQLTDAALLDVIEEKVVFCIPAKFGPPLFNTDEGRRLLLKERLRHVIHHQRYTLQSHEIPPLTRASLVEYGHWLVGDSTDCPKYQVLPWSAASAAGGAAGPRHQDKQWWVVRAVCGITTSGRNREILIDGKGYKSSLLKPESGGVYVLSPPGAGAPTGSPLFHTVSQLDSDNLNFMIDFHCASEADANTLHKIIYANVESKKAAAAAAAAAALPPPPPSPPPASAASASPLLPLPPPARIDVSNSPLPPIRIDVGKIVDFTTNIINSDLDPHSPMLLQFYYRLGLDERRLEWVFDGTKTPQQQIKLAMSQCGE
jgi:hypothetical protein